LLIAAAGLLAALLAPAAGLAAPRAGAEPPTQPNAGVVHATTSRAGAPAQAPETYATIEIIDAGHGFFGQISGSLAALIERVFADFGAPSGYILGEEGSGAVIGGLRYGEGVLYTRAYPPQRIYWQGPSIGWDVGGDGARVMMLLYGLPSPETLFQRFAGVNGSAYLVGGLGFTVLSADTTHVVPVRAGLGARLGVNLGYLKFTPHPTWNPF
jgi:hypothetical protein